MTYVVQKRILMDAGYDRLVEEERQRLFTMLEQGLVNVSKEVVEELDLYNERHWTSPIKRIAKK